MTEHSSTPSVQFIRSGVSNSLWPHALQNARLPCLSPDACSNSCPSSYWCHPTVFVIPIVNLFSSCLQSFPASGSFQISQLFTSGGQSIGASASALVLPKNIQGWFTLGLTCLISLLSKRLSLLQHHSSKASILRHSAFFIVQFSHPYITTGKTLTLLDRPLLAK